MTTLPAPPPDQSTAMNAATPSSHDFVDRTRLVQRRLRTEPADADRRTRSDRPVQLPSLGPQPRSVRIQRPPTVRRHAGAARHDHRLVQLGGYRRHVDHLGRCPMRSGAQRRRVPRLPTPPHADATTGTTKGGDPGLRQPVRTTGLPPHGRPAPAGTTPPVEPRLHERATKRNHHHRGHVPNPTLPRVRLGDTAASEARQACLSPQVLGANQGHRVSPPSSAERTQSVSRDTLHHKPRAHPARAGIHHRGARTRGQVCGTTRVSRDPPTDRPATGRNLH